MITISTTYKEKWVFKDNPKYIITECKKVINIQRGVIIKKTVKGSSIGWWIGSKFIDQKNINKEVRLIIKNKLPF